MRTSRKYRQAPAAKAKEAITARFNTLCQTKTTFRTLNQALKRLARNQKELLLVLERPDIPLHNNLSERDIREYVIKRKISGSTRSAAGRRCRDTFASLKKTCQKQKVSFWDYLMDRLTLTHAIPSLHDLVGGKAFPPLSPPPLMARGYPFGQDAMDGPYAVTSTLVVRPITRRRSHGEPAASHSGNGGLRVAHARPLRRRIAGLGQTSRQYRTGMHGVIEKLPICDRNPGGTSD